MNEINTYDDPVAAKAAATGHRLRWTESSHTCPEPTVDLSEVDRMGPTESVLVAFGFTRDPERAYVWVYGGERFTMFFDGFSAGIVPVVDPDDGSPLGVWSTRGLLADFRFDGCRTCATNDLLAAARQEPCSDLAASLPECYLWWVHQYDRNPEFNSICGFDPRTIASLPRRRVVGFVEGEVV